MIYNIYGQPNLTRYGFWLANCKDIMCQSCDQKAKKVAVESGFLEWYAKNKQEELRK
jgi:hypothetical protein